MNLGDVSQGAEKDITLVELEKKLNKVEKKMDEHLRRHSYRGRSARIHH